MASYIDQQSKHLRQELISGAITLHNYPRFLQELRRDNGEVFDLAAVDILRERGVYQTSSNRVSKVCFNCS
ncbi:MAG: hypothetical protein VKN60_03885 [Cyanobacteriota bacterium]|nr:hypothetical protein [Cyanobacteriota bacterium]